MRGVRARTGLAGNLCQAECAGWGTEVKGMEGALGGSGCGESCELCQQ